jgi:hypothetical protein
MLWFQRIKYSEQLGFGSAIIPLTITAKQL